MAMEPGPAPDPEGHEDPESNTNPKPNHRIPKPNPDPGRASSPAAAPRPPKTDRERFTRLHSLPPYTGPCHVGFMEIELPAREPRSFSHIKRNGEYALKIDTVLFAVYYPCEQPQESSQPASKPQGWKRLQPGLRWKKRKQLRPSRPPWLPRPRDQTCKGYAKFISVPTPPVTAYIALTSMFTKLPAYRNAKLLVGGGLKKNEEEEGKGGRKEVGFEGQSKERPKFPLIFFSHGLGGSRTSCSVICGELASFGFVVVAMEHRDGSGARTYVNKEEGKQQQQKRKQSSSENLTSQKLDRRQGAPEKEKERKQKHHHARRHGKKEKKQNKSHYVVDYLFPKENAFDTSPNNSRGVDEELRHAQIRMRLAEIQEAYHVLGLIDSGRGQEVSGRNLRRKGNVGSSSRALEGIAWSDWESRLHLDHVTMMGHSFGGATTVEALRLKEELPWFTQGILLDPWCLAIPESSSSSSNNGSSSSSEEEREKQQAQPPPPLEKDVLSIGSEAFMHWKGNFDRVEQLCQEARAAGARCWMTTIRGSTHLSQTDFAILYPNWMSLLLKTIVNPGRAIYLTLHSALEFLQATLPPHHLQSQTRLSSTNSSSAEFCWAPGEDSLLEGSGAETLVSFDHRPDTKWTGARLKIRNEFQLRLRNRWARWRNKLPPGRVPKDASGRPLAGLWGAGDEIFVHLSPGKADVE